MSETAVVSSPSPPSWLERSVAWLKGRERFFLLAGAGFQVLVLVGMIALRVMPHITGDTVLLRVVPVDPRDMFRGDYVTLGYAFSRIPAEGIQGIDARDGQRRDWDGRTVYVTLVPEADARYYRADKFWASPPPEGTKYIRGTVVGRGRIEYGIESYYVQEGEGRNYERAVRNRRLSAEVSLAPDGQAALKALRIE